MGSTEAGIEARLAGIGPGQPAAQDATAELLADLGREPLLRVREQTVSRQGAKGGSAEILVTLGSSGAIAGLVQIVKLWLARDRRRALRVSVRNTADGVNITVEGEDVSVATLTEALASAIKLDQDTGMDGTRTSPD